ncbi:MAG: hypothetical protein ACKOJF_34405, partial [Planctomycetaceae bacterium]
MGVLSVGGDGARDPSGLDPLAIDIVRHAAVVTVRNRSDPELIGHLCADVRFHPDMVWGFGRHFPGARPRNERLRIGLDLYPSLLRRTGGLGLFARLQRAILANRSA